MATREETLLGFQLVEQINTGNELTHCSAAHLQGKDVLTEEPLPGDSPEQRKRMCEDNCLAVDVEVTQRLVNFLSRFPDEDIVRKALAHFNTPRSALDRDGLEVMHHTVSVRNVNALLSDVKDLDDNGKLLSLYKEDVEQRANHETHIPSSHRRINVFQDLLNVIAFELRGVCSYTGEARYANLEERRKLVASRIETAENVWATCPETRETLDMFRILQDVKGNLPSLFLHADFDALGEYVNLHVPQLPLVRRWWNY